MEDNLDELENNISSDELVCFDVCGTLHQGNTTQNYCVFVQQQLRPFICTLLRIALLIASVLAKFKTHRLSHIFSQYACVLSLKNIKKKKLDKLGRLFWDNIWEEKIIKPLLNKLKQYKYNLLSAHRECRFF